MQISDGCGASGLVFPGLVSSISSSSRLGQLLDSGWCCKRTAMVWRRCRHRKRLLDTSSKMGKRTSKPSILKRDKVPALVG